MLEEIANPQIGENLDDMSSDELYRPEGQSRRITGSLCANSNPQANSFHNNNIHQKSFSTLELVEKNIQPRLSAMSLQDIPVRKVECARCCWKFLSLILFLSCIALGVLLLLSLQEGKDLSREVKELKMKLAKHDELENDLRIYKEKLEGENDFNQEQMTEMQAIYTAIEELAVKLNKNEERVEMHSEKLRDFKMPNSEDQDIQNGSQSSAST